jgi:hypothetical protein
MQPLPSLNSRPRPALNRLTIALALVLGAGLLWAVVAELRFQRRTTEKMGEDYLSLLSRERLDAASSAFRAAERISRRRGRRIGIASWRKDGIAIRAACTAGTDRFR